MKRPNVDAKAVILIVLVLVSVLYDTFTTGFRILPLPVLSFLQGFIFIAAPGAIWWMIARKIKFKRDRRRSGIDINYSSLVNYQADEKMNTLI
jgi:hypothetical protein